MANIAQDFVAVIRRKVESKRISIMLLCKRLEMQLKGETIRGTHRCLRTLVLRVLQTLCHSLYNPNNYFISNIEIHDIVLIRVLYYSSVIRKKFLFVITKASPIPYLLSTE